MTSTKKKERQALKQEVREEVIAHPDFIKTYDRALEILKGDVSINDYIAAYIETCMTERLATEGLQEFLELAKRENVDIELSAEEQKKILSTIDRFSRLRLTRKLIHLMGLSAFEDALMAKEIEKTYPPTGGSPVQVKRITK